MRRRFWRRDAELSCREVGRVLQQLLDGAIDDLTAQRVRRHLDACRRCGLEAATYEAIKDALGRRADLDDVALRRLQAFGEQLAAGEDPVEGAGGRGEEGA